MRTLKKIIPTATALMLLVAAIPASAKQWQVKMLNKGAAGMMVFEPAFIKISPGDTVKFVGLDKGHNAEAIAGLIPAAASPFKGKINENIVVKFTAPGLYGYKCLPHLGMGMVGLVQVRSAGNKDAVTAGVAKLPNLAKVRMAALLAQAK